MKKTVRTLAILSAGALALSLAACGHKDEQEAPIETNVTNIEEPMNVAVDNTVVETPAPVNTATPAPVARSEDFTDPAQTQDDADATGMTARVSRGEDNTSQPAQ